MPLHLGSRARRWKTRAEQCIEGFGVEVTQYENGDIRADRLDAPRNCVAQSGRSGHTQGVPLRSAPHVRTPVSDRDDEPATAVDEAEGDDETCSHGPRRIVSLHPDRVHQRQPRPVKNNSDIKVMLCPRGIGHSVPICAHIGWNPLEDVFTSDLRECHHEAPLLLDQVPHDVYHGLAMAGRCGGHTTRRRYPRVPPREGQPRWNAEHALIDSAQIDRVTGREA